MGPVTEMCSFAGLDCDVSSFTPSVREFSRSDGVNVTITKVYFTVCGKTWASEASKVILSGEENYMPSENGFWSFTGAWYRWKALSQNSK